MKQIGKAIVVTHEKGFSALRSIYCGWDPGVRQVAEYFAARGCRCPVLLKESANAECCRIFEESCRTLGIKEWKIINCQPENLASHPEFRKGLPGDGIFCSSEKFRVVMRSFLKGKKDFPFVVLMDDYLISQVLPEHPVLRRREPEAGALAVKMLMAQINGEEENDSSPVELPMEFMLPQNKES